MKHMSDKKVIITLGRECGSGGHEIGEKLSKKLGIAFYDKNLIELAAKHSGLDLNVLGATMRRHRVLLFHHMHRRLRISCTGRRAM